MEARNDQATTVFTEDRPAHIFCSKIAFVLAECKKVIGLEKKVFTDPYKKYRDAIQTLEQKLKTFQTNLFSEEERRPPFQVSHVLYNEAETAKENYQQAIELLNKLEIEYQTIQDDIKTELNEVNESITQQHLADTAKAAEDIKRFSKLSDSFQQERRILVEKRIEAEKDLNATWCFCFDFCIAKELQTLDDIEAKIRHVDDKLSRLNETLDIQSEESDTLKKLKEKRSDLNQKLQDHFINHRKKILEAQKKVDMTAEIYFPAENRIKEYKQMYYSYLSRQGMIFALQVYDRFLEIRKLMVNLALNVEEIVAKNKENIPLLAAELNNLKLELPHIFDRIWCAESNDIKGLAAYEKLQTFGEDDKKLLLSPQPPSTLIDRLLPLSPGLLFDSLMKQDVIQISLFSARKTFTRPQFLSQASSFSLAPLPTP